jgi:hypothetical protein
MPSSMHCDWVGYSITRELEQIACLVSRDYIEDLSCCSWLVHRYGAWTCITWWLSISPTATSGQLAVLGAEVVFELVHPRYRSRYSCLKHAHTCRL